MIKSDTATTTSERSNFTDIVCESVGTYDGGGLRISNAAGGVGLTGLNIRGVTCNRTIFVIDFECSDADAQLIDSVNIDGVFGFVPQTYGVRNVGRLRRCRISNGVIYNPGGQGALTAKAVGAGAGDDVPELDFENFVVTNSLSHGFELYGRNALINMRSNNNAAWGYLAQPGSRVSRSNARGGSNGSGDFGPGGATYYPGETVIAPIPLSLVNGWANFGSGKPVAAVTITDDGYVRLSGLIASGTLGSHCTVLPTGFRPSGEMRFLQASSASGVNGTTHVLVLANGQVIPQAEVAMPSCRWTASRSEST